MGTVLGTNSKLCIQLVSNWMDKESWVVLYRDSKTVTKSV